MNDKKKITIIGITGVTMLIAAIAAPLAIKNSGGFRLRAEPDPHTIEITSLDSYREGDFDEYGGSYFFDFSGDFEGTDGETYTVNSYEGQSYISVYDKENISFTTEGCLFEIKSANWEYGMIYVLIHSEYAQLDVTESRVDYYVDEITPSNYNHFDFSFDSYESDNVPDYDVYSAVINTSEGGNYGKKLLFTQIKLVFTCLA